jgi:hypothetical protein
VFNYAKRWKVWRVYVPLFVLLYLPALANADVHAHAAGFACGLILGPWLPPHPRVPYLGRMDSLEDVETPEDSSRGASGRTTAAPARAGEDPGMQ